MTRGRMDMPPGPGRPKGSENKATTQFKQALNNLLEYSAPKMIGWLERVAQDNPEKALDTVSKYIEYVYPKLARVDSSLSGPDGGPLVVNVVKFKETE